jgi:LmbE family N-acetylglucosaminyl deacetylase
VNHYHRFVTELARLVKRVGRLFPKPAKRSSQRKPNSSAPKALIFSPHPDDECIVGGLALRLSRQLRWSVVNVAVTLGSKRLRRAARLRELKSACQHLDFGLLVAGGKGLEKINFSAHTKNKSHWAKAVKVIADILTKHQPRVIFLPHEQDGHETHVGTHHLVMDALKKMPTSFQCFIVETEFWGLMATPNLLVEISANDLADLMAALSCHVGEMKRNPYHLRLSSWMVDNVRRSELIGGPGTASPDFMFAIMYRLRQWKRGRLVNVLKHRKFLSAKDNPGKLFA